VSEIPSTAVTRFYPGKWKCFLRSSMRRTGSSPAPVSTVAVPGLRFGAVVIGFSADMIDSLQVEGTPGGCPRPGALRVY
jgi:hypothetical protein